MSPHGGREVDSKSGMDPESGLEGERERQNEGAAVSDIKECVCVVSQSQSVNLIQFCQ